MSASKPALILVFLVLGFIGSCSNSGSDDLEVLEDHTGILSWGGSPAVDGTGLLLESGDTIYGIPGDKSDHSYLFPDNTNTVNIRTDIVITGNETVRGWGSTYPEAILINAQRLSKQS
ncbi:hypothetical protein ACKGJO_07885 [Gracilimonas sp. Q87]|uniref:hypothetical protein n=1 Tax=Gracilimonas sp. Q87 TaxID=3384766 RepID=UPI003983DD8E